MRLVDADILKVYLENAKSPEISTIPKTYMRNEDIDDAIKILDEYLY